MKNSSSFLEALKEPGQWLEQNTTPLKSSRKLKAGIATLPDGQNIFVKRYYVPKLCPGITSVMIKKKVDRIMRISNHLLQAGVAVPKPYLVIRDFSVQRPSFFLVSQALQDVFFFRKALRQNQVRGASGLTTLLNRIGENTGKMHKAGVVHRDLKGTNIMTGSDPDQPIYFIDFDAARRFNFPDNHIFALDLARLALEIAENMPGPGVLQSLLSA
ncbi:MAG: lipopolysaccharide kinase InaA family protein [Desulfonatronovibrio sp.]